MVKVVYWLIVAATFMFFGVVNSSGEPPVQQQEGTTQSKQPQSKQPIQAKQEEQSKPASASDPATNSGSNSQATENSKPKPRLGIQTKKPAEQPFVELSDGRFMVPYSGTIPGTEIKFTMIPIPGGTFLMGSPDSEEDRMDDEGPQFEVAVKPFWMGKYEVTWEEYMEYMRLNRHFKALQAKGMRKVTPENEIDGVTAPSVLYKPEITFEAGEDIDEAAASMSQFSAKQYTKWLSLLSDDFYRLPTEAEWEYACRAGTTTAYYFGDDTDDLEDHCWHIENSDYARQAVGVLEPNPWGLYDMYGNVAEWVLDQYNEDGYEEIESEAVTAENAYKKPTKLYPRVVRGGHYLSEPEECRSASRLDSENDWRATDPQIPRSPLWLTDEPALGVGIRLLRPLEAPSSRKAKEAFWAPDVPEIMEAFWDRQNAKQLGSFGVVDPKLPDDIKAVGSR